MPGLATGGSRVCQTPAGAVSDTHAARPRPQAFPYNPVFGLRGPDRWGTVSPPPSLAPPPRGGRTCTSEPPASLRTALAVASRSFGVRVPSPPSPRDPPTPRPLRAPTLLRHYWALGVSNCEPLRGGQRGAAIDIAKSQKQPLRRGRHLPASHTGLTAPSQARTGRRLASTMGALPPNPRTRPSRP